MGWGGGELCERWAAVLPDWPLLWLELPVREQWTRQESHLREEKGEEGIRTESHVHKPIGAYGKKVK